MISRAKILQNQIVFVSETVIKSSHMVLEITSKQDIFIVL